MKRRCETCKHPAKVCLSGGYYCFRHAQAIRLENICVAEAINEWNRQRGNAFRKWQKDCEAIVRAMVDCLECEKLVNLAREACASYDATMAIKRPTKS